MKEFICRSRVDSKRNFLGGGMEKIGGGIKENIYRYTCKGCGAIREVRTLRELTADQKRHIRKSDCLACLLKGITKGDGK